MCVHVPLHVCMFVCLYVCVFVYVRTCLVLCSGHAGHFFLKVHMYYFYYGDDYHISMV